MKSCLESYESSDQSRDSQIAAGAGDFKIKWRLIGQNSDEPTTIVGHEAPILSIALDPHADLIASSSCDGTFRVFRLADQTEVHKEKLWEKSSDVKYAKCPGTVLIEPENGELFAVLCSDSIRDRFQNSKYQTCPPTLSHKVGCVLPKVVVSILSHAEVGRNDHPEGAPHFSRRYRHV